MVEIEKTTQIQVTANLNVKWILADAEPTTAPTGYVRMGEFDIPLGVLGTLFAFKATA